MTQPDCHLLIVDDDERIRALLGRFLRRNGFLVSMARDAAQARRLLADLPALPCFLIQHSAYDEMVGMAPRSAEPLKIPLNYRNAS